jgi:hypothetical protein
MQSIDGRTEQPALFDGIHNKGGFLPTALAFNEVTTFPNGVIWARYKVVNVKNKKIKSYENKFYCSTCISIYVNVNVIDMHTME